MVVQERRLALSKPAADFLRFLSPTLFAGSSMETGGVRY
jgi:hypothetical protein